MYDLKEAIDLIGVHPHFRNYSGSGGIWIGRNVQLADAHFVDWGLARAVARVLNAIANGDLQITPRKD